MSEQREWNVAIIPCGGDRTRLESFAHWHCRDGVRQQQVVLKSDLTAANARIAELEQIAQQDYETMQRLIDHNENLESTNARLRELLRECRRDVPETLKYRINNELAEGGR